MTSFSIRLAVAGDFDAYLDAFEAVAAEGRWMGAEAPLDREARRVGFDRAVEGDGAVLFLAEGHVGAHAGPGAAGGIVGACFGSLSGGIADLGMFVADGWRGGGVGAALLGALVDWARRAGAHKVSLAAWTGNHPAIGLYARFGFRVEGVRRRHYRRRSGALWDSVVMGLVLDEASAGGPGRSAPVRPSIVIPEGGIAGAGGVALRLWRPSDAPALVTLVDDPDIRRWLDRIPDPYSADDAAEYITDARVQLTGGTAATLAVTVDGAPAGSVGLRFDAEDPATAEIGYWVAGPARRWGVATAAARLLSDFGQEALGLRRVELNAAVGNTASRKVAEKAGFGFEGVRRAWRTVGGVPTDFAVYSRICGGP
ncbi:MAG TPA: GNAT family N-acetyltransferase [Acidimicrobiia bacterium]|jgi:RimJ/RimL family protein N-acetyltransferase